MVWLTVCYFTASWQVGREWEWANRSPYHYATWLRWPEQGGGWRSLPLELQYFSTIMTSYKIKDSRNRFFLYLEYGEATAEPLPGEEVTLPRNLRLLGRTQLLHVGHNLQRGVLRNNKIGLTDSFYCFKSSLGRLRFLTENLNNSKK